MLQTDKLHAKDSNQLYHPVVEKTVLAKYSVDVQ